MPAESQVDFLVGAGIKPVSIVSYNHLGNNDGMNLSAPQTFRSKVGTCEMRSANVHVGCEALKCLTYSRQPFPSGEGAGSYHPIAKFGVFKVQCVVRVSYPLQQRQLLPVSITSCLFTPLKS